MKDVLIIWSTHRELGHATAGELRWLLGRLRPDVLFLEHSAADHSSFLDGSYGTLESAAVKHYRMHHEVELIPVDLQLVASGLEPKFDRLFQRIEKANPRYCELVLANGKCTEEGGFAYLNSWQSVWFQSGIHREMRATVEALGDPDVADQFALWTRTNDRRESAMVSSIEAFASQRTFRKGALVVGAGHQPTLLERAQALRSAGTSTITWDFGWQLEVAAGDGGASPDNPSLHDKHRIEDGSLPSA
jgi:hypothetical protein